MNIESNGKYLAEGDSMVLGSYVLLALPLVVDTVDYDRDGKCVTSTS